MWLASVNARLVPCPRQRSTASIMRVDAVTGVTGRLVNPGAFDSVSVVIVRLEDSFRATYGSTGSRASPIADE